MTKRLIIIALCALAVCSCNAISSLVHDDQVVARAGKQKLFKSQLDAYIPEGVSAEDSTNLALQYITTWATEILFNEKASQQLSRAELDVTEELEAYKRSLLKFRYEQLYVNERLDTLVTAEDIESFYNEHQSFFVLERPILKVRFMDIMKNSDHKDELIIKMASNKEEDIVGASELGFYAALKYFDTSDTWTDALLLAREFGLDYGTMLSKMQKSMIVYEPEGKGDVKIAYVCDIRTSGVAPLDFCAPRVRDFILSGRKHDLLLDLEQDLLDEARKYKQFVIY